MVSCFVVLLAFCAMPTAADPADDPQWPEFQKFIKTYHRTYMTPSEVAGRFVIFKDNLKRIEERNAKGQEKHGINKFTDMTPEEFEARYMGYRKGIRTTMKRKQYFSPVPRTSSINWCDKGACTPVKDQGGCGSCWAFDATEMVESDYKIRFGQLYNLSPQQLTSCDLYSSGCTGGNAVWAWDYIHNVGGLDPSVDYPYTSGTTGQTGTCKVNTSDFKVGVKEYVWVGEFPFPEESDMLKEIGSTPLSIAADATIWSSYTGGVITSKSNCGTRLNHNIQLVGYQAEGNGGYWIVRNSWGADWGEQGFIYIQEGENVCGVADEASYVVTQAPTLEIQV